MPGANASKHLDHEYLYGTFLEEDLLHNLQLAFPRCKERGPEWPSTKDRILKEMNARYQVGNQISTFENLVEMEQRALDAKLWAVSLFNEMRNLEISWHRKR